MRKEDGLEVEDDVVLQELIKSEKEVWLIAKKISGSSNRKNGVAQIAKVSTLNQKDPSLFDANSLKLLKIHGSFSDSFLFIFKSSKLPSIDSKCLPVYDTSFLPLSLLLCIYVRKTEKIFKLALYKNPNQF